jgi:hypothetical protein
VALDVDVGVVGHVEDDLDDPAPAELEAVRVGGAHPVAAVVADAQALAAQRQAPEHRPDLVAGQLLVVDVQLQGPDRLVVLTVGRELDLGQHLVRHAVRVRRRPLRDLGGARVVGALAAGRHGRLELHADEGREVLGVADDLHVVRVPDAARAEHLVVLGLLPGRPVGVGVEAVAHRHPGQWGLGGPVDDLGHLHPAHVQDGGTMSVEWWSWWRTWPRAWIPAGQWMTSGSHTPPW